MNDKLIVVGSSYDPDSIMAKMLLSKLKDMPLPPPIILQDSEKRLKPVSLEQTMNRAQRRKLKKGKKTL